MLTTTFFDLMIVRFMLGLLRTAVEMPFTIDHVDGPIFELDPTACTHSAMDTR